MTIEFGGFRLEEDRRELLFREAPVALEPRAFDFLRYLIHHRDRAVSKQELQDEVWGTIVGDAAIAQCAAKLRKALRDTAEEPRVIRTVRGHGYRFIAEIEEVPDTPPGHRISRHTSADVPALAVLPLADMSSGRDSAYFGDGIAEEILILLSRLESIRVISRTSSFAFRERDIDLPSIGAALGADYILEGSIRRQSARVRISINLVDAATDTQLWNRTYDREMVDVFAVQSQIAAAIVDELDVVAHGQTRRYDATRSPEAYDYFLRGRHYFHQWDERAMEYSREMYEKAIELDPEYAKAWAGLAETLTCAELWKDSEGALAKLADEASRKALEFGPQLSESHCSRGFTLSMDGRYEESFAEFEEAMTLDPRNFEAAYLYARCRFAAGDLEEAAALFARAGDIRREDYQSICLEAQAHQAQGNEAAGREAASRGLDRCRRHLTLYPEDTRAWTLGSGVLIQLEDREEGIRWARHALDLAPDDITVLHNVGCTFAQAGLIDESLDVLEKRFSMGSFDQDWIDQDPHFDNLRKHPRFLRMTGHEVS